MVEKNSNGKKLRGFALMKPEQVKSIASRGGKAAHAKGVAHQWTSAEAKEAGRKGGLAVHPTRRSDVATARMTA